MSNVLIFFKSPIKSEEHMKIQMIDFVMYKLFKLPILFTAASCVVLALSISALATVNTNDGWKTTLYAESKVVELGGTVCYVLEVERTGPAVLDVDIHDVRKTLGRTVAYESVTPAPDEGGGENTFVRWRSARMNQGETFQARYCVRLTDNPSLLRPSDQVGNYVVTQGTPASEAGQSATPKDSSDDLPGENLRTRSDPPPKRVSVDHYVTAGAREGTAANNPNTMLAEDPVNTATGEFVLDRPIVDLDLGGPLPLRFQRWYASALNDPGIDLIGSALGRGWMHSFEAKALYSSHSLVGINLRVVLPGGKIVTFAKIWPSETWTLNFRMEPVDYKLVDDGRDYWVLDPSSGLLYRFAKDGPSNDSLGGGKVLALLEILDRNGNSHLLTYADNGRLTSVTDGLGRTLTFSYADNGNLTGVSDGTRTVTFSANAQGVITTATDTMGRVTQYSYDPDKSFANNQGALLTAIRHPRANTPATMVYDADGRVVKQTDAYANITTFVYDPETGVTTIVSPRGESEQAYANYRRVTRTEDQAGQAQVFAYAGVRDLVTGLTDRRGNQTEFAYEPDTGRPLSVQHRNDATTTYQYIWTTQTFTNRDDAAHSAQFAFRDLSTITHPGNRTEAFGRDARGNVTLYMDGTMAGWVTTFNSRGQPLTVTRPEGGTTTFSYNADGTLATMGATNIEATAYTYDALRRLTKISRPDGTEVSWTLNARDRLTTMTNAAGGVTAYTYDDNGNLIKTVDPLGHELSGQFDLMDRLARQESSAGPFLDQEFDEAGLRIKAEDPAGATTFAHDARGWITRIVRAGRTWGWAYDAEGNITRVTNPLDQSVVFTHDALGRPLTETNALNQVSRYQYDALGRLISSRNPLNQETVFGYDVAGRLTRITDPLGRHTNLAYDGDGNLIRRTDPDGHATRFTHTSMGLPGTTVNALNQTTRLVYDTFGRLIRREYADETREEFGYDQAGRVNALTDEAGRVWRTTFDANGNILTATNPLSGVATSTYHPDGLPHTVTDTDTGVTTYHYDDARRLVKTVHPDDSEVHYAYNAHHERTEVRDELNRRTAYTYDAAGQLTRIMDPADKHTDFIYDAAGRLIRRTDRTGAITHYEYDAAGRLTVEIDPTGVRTGYTYDAAGRLVSRTIGGSVWSSGYNASGVQTSMTTPSNRTFSSTLDALHRVVAEKDPLNQTWATAYDARGRVIASTDPASRAIRRGYDPRGRLASVTLPDNGVATYAYDAAGILGKVTDLGGSQWNFANTPMGRLQKLTDPLDRETGHAYDTRGRLRQITFADSATLTLTRDAAGQVTNRTSSGGPNLNYTYDALGNVATTEHIALTRDAEGRITATRDGSTTFGATYDPAGRLQTTTYNNNAFTVTYTYSIGADGTGLLTGVSDSLTGTQLAFSHDQDFRPIQTNLPNGQALIQTWDNADRLVRIQSDGHVDIQITRDAGDRITQVNLVAPLTPDGHLAGNDRQWTVDAASQITAAGFTYDPRGRLTATPDYALTWDGASRLTAINTISLNYNGLNQLRAITRDGGTTHFYTNHAIPTQPVVAERDGADGAFLRYYVWSPAGKLLYLIDAATSQAFFYHFDQVGSTLALTNAAGAVTDAYAYDPFGRILARTGANPQPFTFVGQHGVIRENSRGLYSMRARWYDADLGRFLSPEPVWPQLDDPIQINPYQYAGNEPVRLMDPSGLGHFIHGLSRFDTGLRDWFHFGASENTRLAALKEIPKKESARESAWMRTFSPGELPQDLRDAYFDRLDRLNEGETGEHLDWRIFADMIDHAKQQAEEKKQLARNTMPPFNPEPANTLPYTYHTNGNDTAPAGSPPSGKTSVGFFVLPHLQLSFYHDAVSAIVSEYLEMTEGSGFTEYSTTGQFQAQTEHTVYIGGDAKTVDVYLMNNVTGESYLMRSIPVYNLEIGRPYGNRPEQIGVPNPNGKRNQILDLFSKGISDELRGRYLKSGR